MERKEFEAFIEERLEEIRQEWVKFGPKDHALSLTVWHDVTAALAFTDIENGKKCVDYWRWHRDSDS